jgi:N-carbamoylputrescine amidase
MRITVCELPDDRREFASQWQALGEHVRHTGSEWVLLPDMPFCRWPRDSGGWHKDAWSDCVRAHDRIESKLRDLAPAHVLGSRPIDFGNERYVEAFIWDREQGLRSSHAQCGAGDTGLGASPVGPEFTPFDVRGVRIGFMVGKELWMTDAARSYAKDSVDLLAIPRSGGASDFGAWLERATLVACSMRAYVASSNRSGEFGGHGWIIGPDGHVHGLTTPSQPFVTHDLDIEVEPMEGPEPIPRPAPDWLDFWETGVPPW